jgi:hypothetical protein
LDPMLAVGAVANLAGLVTFLDWAAIKSKARKQKKPLGRSVKSLEKLETSLREVDIAIQGKRDLVEVKHCIDRICEAKADLIEDLREMGVEIPKEESLKVRGFSDEGLLAMVNLCKNSVVEAKNELLSP